MAIGARCQSAKTYLEKKFESFPSSNFRIVSRDELILHAVQAIKNSAQSEVELNGRSVSVAIVGVDTAFKFLSEGEVNEVLSRISQAMEVEL